MALEIIGKLVSVVDESVIGYLITAGSEYTSAVTLDKAKEIGVQDIEIAQWLDVRCEDVVPIRQNCYALVENNSGFFEEFKEIAREYFGDRILYYGYYFEGRYIVDLDNDMAIKRMIDSASGNYVE